MHLLLLFRDPHLDEVHAHLVEALVHRRVVDDFVGDPELRVGMLLARLVRHLHRALDAPAETVRIRELWVGGWVGGCGSGGFRADLA